MLRLFLGSAQTLFLLAMFQEMPGLFGTATGEYFDAAAEFQVFDDARLHFPSLRRLIQK